MIKYKGIEYNCSMELTLDMIGGKWKPIIIWYLGQKTMRFRHMKKNNKSKILVYFVSGKEVGSADSYAIEGFCRRGMAQNRLEY
jgi:hypothetical protein